MDQSTKLIIALGVSGAMYFFLTRKQAIPTPEQSISKDTADRVMSYAADMFQYGKEQGVNPALLAAIMTVESNGRETAHGAAGEVGLMQILPSTGMWIGNVSQGELTLPSVNIQVGAAYIQYCIYRKDRNVAAGVASYNAGPNAVRVEAGKIIAPQSALRYMLKVMGYVEPYRRLFKERLGDFYTIAFPTRAMIS